ncbi:MAG: MotA/TolQ/ExbB proton channel family protein [Phycisphaeraceae bacterium]
MCYPVRVIDTLMASFLGLMDRGGVVMWPLLALSLLSATLLFERCWYYLRANHPGRLAKARRMAGHLRLRDYHAAKTLAQDESGPYARYVRLLLEDETNMTSPLDTVETLRPNLERFMPTLSTIITVAPMLGILGTVLGIIASLQVLSDPGAAATDPRSVGQGIAEALITTAAGLVIAIFTLFPYNALRIQVERTLTMLETLARAAAEGRSADNREHSI